jgi:uncharacterized membrane protein
LLIDIVSFIGRFHPLIVHLPIGILICAAILQIVALRSRNDSLRLAVRISIFWGAVSAIVACITGLILADNDDYDAELVTRHQWTGILVAAIAVAGYIIERWKPRSILRISYTVTLLLFLSVAGHLGGSLTHGSAYLSYSAAEGDDAGTQLRNKLASITNLGEADVYMQIVQPVLEARCYSCHNATKRKGKLRVDELEHLMKGGKNGVVIVPGNAEKSELIRRIMLPSTDDDAMPPKEKAPMSTEEKEILRWWVNAGAPQNKKVKAFESREQLLASVKGLQTEKPIDEAVEDIPLPDVDAANPEAVSKLMSEGVVVLPMAQGQNALSVSFVSLDTVTSVQIDQLKRISKQVVVLKLADLGLRDEVLKSLVGMENLRRLSVENNLLTDDGLKHLANLRGLQVLNITGNKVTAQGLNQLKNLEELKKVYVFNTSVKPADWPQLRETLKRVDIDTGGYRLPMLASDTTEVMNRSQSNLGFLFSRNALVPSIMSLVPKHSPNLAISKSYPSCV